MRRIAPFLFALFLSQPAFAETSRVGDAFLLLTHESGGWRVMFTGKAQARSSLQNGDILTKIDSRDARALGPLAVRLTFSVAYDRTIPVTVRRGTRSLKIGLWRSDGPPPPPKPDASAMKNVSIGTLAPNFAFPALDGQAVALSNLRGKWVLVSFWATWCLPCMQEEPILNRLVRDYRGRLVVLALALKETRANLQAFSAKYKPGYTIIDAGSLKGPVPQAYGVTRPGASTVPVNVLVRPDGNIAYVQSGYEEPSPLEAQVRAAIAGR